MKIKEKNNSSLRLICFSFVFAFCFFCQAESLAKTKTETDSAANSDKFSAEPIITLVPKTAKFLIRAGKASGEKISLSAKRSKNSPEIWTLTFEDFYKLFVYRTSWGAIRITRIELLDRQKAISFSPSIELLPSQIAPGFREEKTSGWTNVFSLKSGKNINEGTFTHSLKVLSRTNFQTPAGEIEGHLLLHESRLDLDFAKLRIQLKAGFSEERQLIYWRSKSLLKKLIFFGSETIHEFIVAN